VFYYRPNHLFGVAVNGVVFDPNTDEFLNSDRRSGWMIEALSGARPFGIDQNNAHVQPNGAYHYHGVPTGLVALLGPQRPVLIGWAADGFPIYVQDAMRPSWRLKHARDGGGPGGTPDGTYSLDYEYVRGLGDLDECNGRDGVTAEFPQGTYYYVDSVKFPHVPRCFVGTADTSFVKQGCPPERPAARRRADRFLPLPANRATTRRVTNGSFSHGSQEDRAGRRRTDWRYARVAGRPEGTGRHRPVRHSRRRGHRQGQGARHRPAQPR